MTNVIQELQHAVARLGELKACVHVWTHDNSVRLVFGHLHLCRERSEEQHG